jgi:hypothetical protein
MRNGIAIAVGKRRQQKRQSARQLLQPPSWGEKITSSQRSSYGNFHQFSCRIAQRVRPSVTARALFRRRSWGSGINDARSRCTTFTMPSKRGNYPPRPPTQTRVSVEPHPSVGRGFFYSPDMRIFSMYIVGAGFLDDPIINQARGRHEFPSKRTTGRYQDLLASFGH